MQDHIVRILSQMIGMQTISAQSNLEIIDYITSMLRPLTENIKIIPNEDGRKASLLASFGPTDRPGIILSGHTDVVPVAGQQWSSDPFTASIRDGRLYGRGSTDMKGFIAVALAHAEEFAAAALEKPVHFCFSYDEEVGCKGAPDLVKAAAGLADSQELCVVGEPTGMRVVYAHKGKVARHIVVHGKGGHSAFPQRGANAAVAAARITVMLDEIARELEKQHSAVPFDPPWSTLHVGVLHSGTALNLIPERADVEFEVRIVPELPAEQTLEHIDQQIDLIQQELQSRMPDTSIKVETLSTYPGLAMDKHNRAVKLALELAHRSEPPEVVSFGSEAGLFQQAGIPTVVCGPGHISRAHKPDEWVGLDELEEASRMMQRVAKYVSVA